MSPGTQPVAQARLMAQGALLSALACCLLWLSLGAAGTSPGATQSSPVSGAIPANSSIPASTHPETTERDHRSDRTTTRSTP